MKLLCIDPGTTQSAYVLYDTNTKRLDLVGLEENSEVLKLLVSNNLADWLVLEQIKSYGNVMGDSVLQTCVWSGRFVQAFNGPHEFIPRKTIVNSLCGNSRAKDTNVRRALLDHFAEIHQMDPKTLTRKGAPLHGVKKDIWSALAVAVTWYEIGVDVFE